MTAKSRADIYNNNELNEINGVNGNANFTLMR